MNFLIWHKTGTSSSSSIAISWSRGYGILNRPFVTKQNLQARQWARANVNPLLLQNKLRAKRCRKRYPKHVNTLKRAGKVVRVQQTRQQLGRRKPFKKVRKSPDVVTYTSKIGYHGGKGDLDKMEQLFGDMAKSKIKPSEATYNVMINNYKKNNEVEKMNKANEEMKKKNILRSVDTYNPQIDYYAQRGDVKSMKQKNHRNEKK